MTDISQLPGTLQAISINDLGVISQAGTFGAVAVKAPLSALPWLLQSGGTVSGTISLTASGNLSWNNVVPTWSGTNVSGQTPINISLSWLGTAGNTGDLVPIGLNINTTSYINAVASGGSGAIMISANSGNIMQGGLTGIQSKVNLTQTTANSGNVEYVALRGFITATVGDGGTGGSPRGSLLAATLVANLAVTGATNFAGLTGLEVAIQAVTGTSAVIKTGIYVMEYAADTVRGSSADNAFAIWNQYAQGATTGWKTLINLGPDSQSGLFFAGGQDCTLIKVSKGATDGSLTVANLIDFSLITTVSGNNIAMPNFQVTGAGAVSGKSFAYNGGGNNTLVYTSGGNAGHNFVSSDGSLGQFGNQSPGSGVTTTPSIQAGAGSVLITTTGSAGTQHIFINAIGASAIIGFNPGAHAQIDQAGNITAPSISNASAVLQVGSTTSDVIIGGRLTTLSATAGFVHLPFTNATSGAGGIPTGTPASATAPAMEWNDVTFTLNVYSPSAAAWKHVTLSAAAG